MKDYPDKMTAEQARAVDGRCVMDDGRCVMDDGRGKKAQISPFAGIPVPDFVDIILHDAKRSDEAMYYLLKQRLNHQLRERYETYQYQLYDEHQQMAQRIYDGFEHLYPILLACYAHTIDSLKCAEAIKQLRQQHYEATGVMAHEPESDDADRITIKVFWNKLNMMLSFE